MAEISLKQAGVHGLFEARYRDKVVAHVYNMPMGLIFVSSDHTTPNTQILASADALDLFLLGITYDLDPDPDALTSD